MPREQSFPGKDHVYDVIVVGAGISGTEAALKLAQAGLDILLLTTSLDSIANTFEDKVSLRAVENSFFYKVFQENNKDGYLDSGEFHKFAKYGLEHSQGIHLLQSSAERLIVEDGIVKGVETWEGVPRYAKHCLLAVGSFLKARLKIGSLEEKSGRLGEMSYDELYEDLKQYTKLKDYSFRIELNENEPSYSVDCKIIAEIQNSEILALKGLYASGFCAGAVSSYEEAIVDAQNAANTILKMF